MIELLILLQNEYFLSFNEDTHGCKFPISYWNYLIIINSAPIRRISVKSFRNPQNIISLHLLNAFYIRTVGVRRRTDKSDYIAEIMELKGGETQGIFGLS